MSSLERVRAGGRGLDRRLAAVPAAALLSGLRAAGAVTGPEVAALGPPGRGGWAGRLRALAVAKGDRTCRTLLEVLQGLEGPERPGPFDFYDPQRDAAPAHRSDCACCRPEEEEEGEPKTGEEGPEEEEAEPKNDEENPEDDEGGGGEEGPEEEEGAPGNEEENPEEDDEGGGNDEGPEEEEAEPKNDEENPEDDEGGDEGHEEEEGDEGPDDDGGDEGPEDDDGGGGDED